MSLGFEMAGYDIRLGIEKDSLPHLTHRLNFLGKSIQCDVAEIEDPIFLVQERGIERVDVIIGGPPCQGFSRVGRGKIRSLRNDRGYLHDPRNQFYLEFIRFVCVLRPSYFVMENVPDLRYFYDGSELLLEKAKRLLEEQGYMIDWRVLRADHHGVPQTRKRLFLIGNRLNHTIRWPSESNNPNPITVWQAIGDLPIVGHFHRLDEMLYEPRFELNQYQTLMREGMDDVVYNHQTRRHNEQDLEAFSLMREGGKYVDLPPEYRRYRSDIFRDKYWKLFRDRPSWTVEAHIGKDTYRHIYPSQTSGPEPPRTISVREAARLQSFPDRFRFVGPFTRQFFQVGNAVPPLMAQAVASAILPGVKEGMSDG